MKVNQNPLSGNTQGLSPSTNSSKQVDKAKDLGKTGEVQKARVDTKSKGTASGTEVEISERAQLMRQAAEAVHALPDVRQDRVDDIKARIKAGTYKVDSQSVADKLVEEHFLTDFSKNNA